jgi:hypothetical protein
MSQGVGAPPLNRDFAETEEYDEIETGDTD